MQTTPSPLTFTPTLKTIKADERGRISLGAIYPASKGQLFQVAIDHEGRVLLTPAGSSNTTNTEAPKERAHGL